jgi:hypothetical protein
LILRFVQCLIFQVPACGLNEGCENQVSYCNKTFLYWFFFFKLRNHILRETCNTTPQTRVKPPGDTRTQVTLPKNQHKKRQKETEQNRKQKSLIQRPSNT